MYSAPKMMRKLQALGHSESRRFSVDWACFRSLQGGDVFDGSDLRGSLTLSAQIQLEYTCTPVSLTATSTLTSTTSTNVRRSATICAS